MRVKAYRQRDRIRALKAELHVLALTSAGEADRPRYLDPVEYARKVLGVEPTPQQIEIARALRESPYMVSVPSANNQGKTFLAAWLVNWWFDTFTESSAVITTAPSAEHVSSVLWGEVRNLRMRAGLPGFETRAMAPLLFDSPDHYAKGLATDRGERLKGRHLRHMLFVIDEAVGVKPWVYDAVRTMFQKDGNHSWLIIGNPTDTTSAMYAEEQLTDLNDAPVWRSIPLSAVDHPNVIAQLEGRGRRLLHGTPEPPPPIPGAVTLDQFETWIAAGSDPLPPADATATDLQWPPEWWRERYTPGDAPRWFRPGPELEAVGLGRWPSQSAGSVWSDAAWRAALVRQEFAGEFGYRIPSDARERLRRFGPLSANALPGPVLYLPEMSCDPARKGKNYTAIFVRCGACALHYEQHNGWEAPKTVGRLKELAREWAQWATARRDPAAAPIVPQQIKVKVDSDGLGAGAVLDWANPGWQQEFAFIGVSAATPPVDATRYLNKRSELWFRTVDLARMGQLDLSRLPRKAQQLLRIQAMAPQWKMDGLGHRVVERKEDLEERGVASPDGMDAVNLGYWPADVGTVETHVTSPRPLTPRDAAEEVTTDADEDSGRPVMFRGR